MVTFSQSLRDPFQSVHSGRPPASMLANPLRWGLRPGTLTRIEDK